jgi:hypothetical protein
MCATSVALCHPRLRWIRRLRDALAATGLLAVVVVLMVDSFDVLNVIRPGRSGPGAP